MPTKQYIGALIVEDQNSFEYRLSKGIDNALTPSKEEQALLILQGKCPHNRGWDHLGYGHNSDAYKCVMCKEMKWW